MLDRWLSVHDFLFIEEKKPATTLDLKNKTCLNHGKEEEKIAWTVCPLSRVRIIKYENIVSKRLNF